MENHIEKKMHDEMGTIVLGFRLKGQGHYSNNGKSHEKNVE